MTTKEYLSQVYLLSVRVRTKQQQAAALRQRDLQQMKKHPPL